LSIFHLNSGQPSPTESPENVEKTRTPYGTSRQIGSAFYLVSSYVCTRNPPSVNSLLTLPFKISHSCAPTARPSFSDGTSELHLIANCDLKKGDEITVAYVDVSQGANESPEEARKRRREELNRGWRFTCSCSRCTLEEVGKSEGADNDDSSSQRDESKVEDVVTRIEDQMSTQ
jgi:import receptor subunit TOM20